MSHRWIFIIVFAVLVTALASAETLLPDFQVNTTRPSHPPQKNPCSVADPTTQTIYTTFLSQRDGSNWDVAFARFNYELQIQGQVAYLNDPGTTCQRPRVALGTNQGCAVSWVQTGHVYFRSLDGLGSPISLPVRVDDDAGVLSSDIAHIATLREGYLLVWYDRRDSSKIYAQKVAFDGSLIGDNFPIQPDSTGSILGLEAQNHPDGRILVSWVTNAVASRGRWLNASGSFLGNVFNMAEPLNDIGNSLVRFAENGTGILYQYVGDYIYTVYLDSMGVQVGPYINHGYWCDGGGGSTWSWYYSYSFPDLQYAGGDIYVKISFYNYQYFDLYFPWVTTQYNCLFSSILTTPKIISGATTDYNICLLNLQQFLVSYTPTQPVSVTMQKHSITNLYTLSTPVGITEPGFDLPQNTSNICVHQNGGFRFTYTTQSDSGLGIFTRYFNADGMPAAPDTQISMNQTLQLIYPGTARMRLTADDKALIAWSSGGNLWGTLFNGTDWSGSIQQFNVTPDLNSASLVPNFDVNENNQAAVAWRIGPSGTISGRTYYQYFPQLFGTPSTSLPLIPSTGTDLPGLPDVGLKQDGHFLVCWNKWQSYVGPIQMQAGNNYSILQGSIVQISEDGNGGACSYPVLRKSPYGYWITWIQYVSPANRRVYLCKINDQGNPVGNNIQVTDSGHIPMGVPALAVSNTTGNVVVTWRDSSASDPGDILARQFNPDGSFYGEYPYRVNSDSGNALQKESAVAFGPNDQLYFCWTDYRTPNHQGDIYAKVIQWQDALTVSPQPSPVPLRFRLDGPRPNPFNATTVASYELRVASQVKLTVWDTAGRLVATLVEGRQPAGTHQTIFDGSGLASGVYLLRLQADSFVASRKLVLLK